MTKINFKENPYIQRIAYLGTGMLMIAPYMLPNDNAFLLLGIGCLLLNGQTIRAKQWNLTVLNFSSGIQYLYNYYNLLG